MTCPLRFWRAGLGAALCLLAGVAQPQEALPDYRMRCGGIGADEAASLRAEALLHALTLVMSDEDGAYLADVPVRLEEPVSGAGVSGPCGPIALFEVPAPGRYRVWASQGGIVREAWVDLRPQGGARLHWRWPP